MEEKIHNKEFHDEMNKIFKQDLAPYENSIKERKIAIKDIDSGSILEHSSKMNYDKLLFDSKLNIYKINPDGSVSLVDTDKFNAVVV